MAPLPVQSRDSPQATRKLLDKVPSSEAVDQTKSKEKLSIAPNIPEKEQSLEKEKIGKKTILKTPDSSLLPEIAKEDLEGLSEAARLILQTEKGLQQKKTEEDDSSTVKRTKESRPPAKSELEERVFREKVESSLAINVDYVRQLSQQPMEKIYREMTSLYQLAEEKGYLNPQEQRRVEYLASAVEKKVQAAEEQSYTMTEEVAQAAGITQQIGFKLRGLYKGNQLEYHPQYR